MGSDALGKLHAFLCAARLLVRLHRARALQITALFNLSLRLIEPPLNLGLNIELERVLEQVLGLASLVSAHFLLKSLLDGFFFLIEQSLGGFSLLHSVLLLGAHA